MLNWNCANFFKSQLYKYDLKVCNDGALDQKDRTWENFQKHNICAGLYTVTELCQHGMI